MTENNQLAAKIFPLRCAECLEVSHKSFLQLEMEDRLPCDSCGISIKVANQYGNTELYAFLESISRPGAILRQKDERD